MHQRCSTSPLAVTWLTVYRQLHIYGMATFDELVLEISLVEVAESLHAKLYLYELNFLPSGVSVVALSVEDTLGQSIFFGTIMLMIFLISQ